MKNISTYARPRPVIELDGTAFYIDADNRKLIQVGCTENEIDFLEMRFINGNLELWYDPETKNRYTGNCREELPGHIEIYWFHQIDALDPFGAYKRLDELNPQWRKDLPSTVKGIDIAGKQFLVDEEDSCFREINNWWNLISFKQVMRKKDKFGIYINMDYHNAALPGEISSKSMNDLPGHIAFTMLPKDRKLKHLLKRYIRKTKMEAKYI